MDNIVYLYELTLKNYIQKGDLLDEYPMFETILIKFVNKNKLVLSSKNLIHQFIVFLHYELDCIFYRSSRKDIMSEVNKIDKSRLRHEVKKLASNIKKLFLQIK